ncbi:hypothetical protein [Nocardia brasiliensis]|uniref:hypothetical protein n=1 Tax=Nocardia brasiliensis TaxID=37326 RepID=UPI00245399C1|nr:hypothetical protein [Nocardia brasiliensis]
MADRITAMEFSATRGDVWYVLGFKDIVHFEHMKGDRARILIRWDPYGSNVYSVSTSTMYQDVPPEGGPVKLIGWIESDYGPLSLTYRADKIGYIIREPAS